MWGGCGARMPPTISPLSLVGLMMVSCSELHTHVLRLREESQRLESSLTSDSALLHAAERDAEVAQEPAVDPHGSRVQSRGDTMGALQVAGPERCREAVLGG